MVLGPFAETKEPVLSEVEGTSSGGGETPHEKGKDTGSPIKSGMTEKRQGSKQEV